MGEQVQFEESVLRGAQQDGVVFQQTRRLHHAAVGQQPSFYRLTQGYYLSRLRIEHHQRTVARRQQQTVLQHVEIIVSCAFRVFHLHTQLEVVAGIDQQVLRSGEKDVVGSVDEEVAPRLSHHRSIDTWQEDIVQFVVDQHLRTVIHEDASLRVHQQLTRIAVARLHRNTLKAVHVCVSTHAVHRGHPQPSVPVAEQTLHVVVGQT